MQTTFSGKETTVTIGTDHPFALIGERLYPKLRRGLAQELREGDFSRAEADAIAQVEAGATLVDVSATLPDMDEVTLLPALVEHVQAAVDVPLSITASSPKALAAALGAHSGKALVNGLTGDSTTLERILPIVAEYGAAFVGMCTDEEGIPDAAPERIAIAERIAETAVRFGVAASDVIIDPVVMPIGARRSVGQTVFTVISHVQQALGLNTCCGVTNVSIGLPNRTTLNAAFLAMLIARGVPLALANPLDDTIRMTALAADMFMGHDENSERWLFANERGADLAARRVERQRLREAQRAAEQVDAENGSA